MTPYEKFREIVGKRTKTEWPKDFARHEYNEDGAMAIGPLVFCDIKAQADQDFIATTANVIDELLAVVEVCYGYSIPGVTHALNEALTALDSKLAKIGGEG